MRRPLLALAALGALLALPAAALAHTGGTAGTDYRSTVRSTPDGMTARMVGGDDRLEVHRTGARSVIVLGYEGEPYLRLDERGVWENRRSPAVALNAQRTSAGTPSGDAIDADPDWVRIGDGATAIFHDHRAHWMGTQPPVKVRANPDTAQVLYDWKVPVIVDGAPRGIEGDVAWVPPPAAWAWWTATALAMLGAFAIGIARRLPTAHLALGGTGVALAAAGALGVSEQLDLPDNQVGAAIAAAVPLAALAIGAALAHRLRTTPVLVATALLLATLVAGGIPLVGFAGAAFSYGLVPGPLPTIAARVLVVLALAALALVAGACGRAWLEATRGAQPEARPRAEASW